MNPSRCSSRSRGPSRFRSRCLALAEMSLCELAALLAPRLSLDAPYPVAFRERLFTPVRIFWLFLAQVFSPGTSCRESVRKALAWLALAESHAQAGGAPAVLDRFRTGIVIEPVVTPSETELPDSMP